MLMSELLRRGAEVVALVPDRQTRDPLVADCAGQIHLIYGRTDNLFRLHSAMAIHEIAAVFHCANANTQENTADKHEIAALLQAVRLYSSQVPVVACLPGASHPCAEELPDERLSIVRVGEVFGPGDRSMARLVPRTARAFCRGESVTLEDVPPRDFVFVRDVVSACLLAAQPMDRPVLREWVFRSGWLMSDRQCVALMEEVWNNQHAVLPSFPIPENPLGWKPAFSPLAAFRETLAWYHDLVVGETRPTRRAA
jgi:nucleoside-diphosphate-sugar epimerase